MGGTTVRSSDRVRVGSGSARFLPAGFDPVGAKPGRWLAAKGTFLTSGQVLAGQCGLHDPKPAHAGSQLLTRLTLRLKRSSLRLYPSGIQPGLHDAILAPLSLKRRSHV